MKNKIKIIGIVSLLNLVLINNSIAQLMLSDKPLFINQSVPPALTLTFDDSGSMSYTWMPDNAYVPGQSTYFAVTSPDYNKMYYNPDREYELPLDYLGNQLRTPKYSFAGVYGFYQGPLVADSTQGDDFYDGAKGLAVDLNTNYIPLRYIIADDEINLIYYGPTPKVDLEYAPLEVDIPRKGFYYKWIGDADATFSEKGLADDEYWQLHEINTAEEKQNFAIWFTYHNTRMKVLQGAVSHAFISLPENVFKLDWQVLNKPDYRFENKPTNMKMYTGNHKKEMYEWLQSVSLDILNSETATPTRRAIKQVGEYFSRSGEDSPYRSNIYNQELSCQQNFSFVVTDGYWNTDEGELGEIDSTNTFLPNLPDGNTVSSILNYNTTLLPMSMYALKGVHTRSDGTTYEYSTLADNTFKFWANDLRPDLVNNVPVYLTDNTDSSGNTVNLETGQQWWENSELFWNPNNDPASWQHVVNYIMTLGLSVGELNPEVDLPYIRSGEKVWPNVYDSFENRLGDTWHAAINSRGKLYTAKEPGEISQGLLDVILDILKRIGRASSGSVSSSIISESSLSYKTGFDSSNWNGFIYATAINKDGTLGDIKWDAGCKLTGGYCESTGSNVSITVSHGDRNIITYDNSVNKQTSFIKTDMTEYQLSNLMDSVYVDSLPSDSSYSSEDFIKYLRGDRTGELLNNGVFRDRVSLLGDVVHSSALVVRGPASNFNDKYWAKDSPEDISADAEKGYNQFRQDNINRKSVILVGANDGMLHAFDAGIDTENGGDEYWAYIPSKALKGMSELASPQYAHRSFVDATPIVRDAFLSNNWTTVALGGMRFGGKLFYALDLGVDLTTTPKVMWEFSDKNDTDMGYSYAGGLITRIAVPNGSASVQSKWVAILPNGYNSTNNKSVMYAIDLETGVKLHKWETDIGSTSEPNGMGPPVAADFVVYDSEDTSKTYYGADQGTDFVYAGDLAGNIYRFDMKDIFTGNKIPEILYQGSYNNPVTTAPRLFTPEDGTENIVLVFGTGKYIEQSDKINISSGSHYLVGLRDSQLPILNSYSIEDERLVEQEFSNIGGSRKISSNNVNRNQGWKIALPDNGERIINSIVRNNQTKTLVATSIIPVSGDPCQSGGKSWVMVLDALSGSVPASGSVFKNPQADGILINDVVLGVNTLTVPGGNNQFFNIDTSSDEGTEQITIELTTNTGWRRRSWHRLLF